MRCPVRGYAEQSGSRFRWTVKVKPVMVAAHLWDEKGQPGGLYPLEWQQG